MLLFRPVGEAEYLLIKQSDFKKFPPRLPEQPIFYPVLNIEYAREIAIKWNKGGYVLKFAINDAYIDKFKIQTVRASYHKEYWIPAEKLDEFNDNITSKIEAVEKY